ncbi:hypothetical protein BDY24DRAFT_437969 [Mrakia frigida]|uniref:uncharacterized protein n=1 Tax=Mrakia frigida TaxID=29902 RepID=UPI003FCC17FF
MNSQAPLLMSAEQAWPARPSNRGLPSPALNNPPSSSSSSALVASNPSSPTPSSSPNFAQGSFPSSSSSAYEPSEGGGGRRRRTKSGEEGGDTSLNEKKVVYGGTPLSTDKVARIAQAFGVNVSLPPSSSSSSSSPPYRIQRLQRPARSLSSSAPPPPPSSNGALPPSSNTRSRPPSSSSSTSSKHFLSVLPPLSLAPKSSSPSGQFRRGELLPLHPTLPAQIQAIANEYGLPSTVGIVLFLVYERSETGAGERGEPGPRIGKETWRMLWQEVFSSEGAGGDERAVASFYEPAPSPQPLEKKMDAAVAAASTRGGGGRALRIATTTTETSGGIPSSSSTTSSSPPPPISASASISTFSSSTTHFSFNRPNTPIASTSLLTRDPATLSPSFLRSNHPRRSPNLTPTKRHRRTLTASTNPSSTSSLPTPLSASTTTTTTSSSATSHYLSPATALLQGGGGFAPPPLRIVGTVEFDVDTSRGGEWYGTWLKGGRRGVERVGLVEPTREVEEVEAVVEEEKGASSQSDYDDDEEEISDGGSGYVPLSDDEDDEEREETLTRETSEEPRLDEREEEVSSSRQDQDQEDPLGDVFPSDEQEWNDLRASREEEDDEQQQQQQGLGIRSSRGGRDSLLLTGGELSRGLDRSEFEDEEEEVDLDRKEIEDLLARHPPAPGFGGESSPTSPKDLSSSTPSTRRNTTTTTTTTSRPSRLTLASPISLETNPNHFLPVLTTSPTASEANSHSHSSFQRALGSGPLDDNNGNLPSPTSEFSGGLAYLRDGSMDESSERSERDSIEGGMSAAMEGAFGIGEHGEMQMLKDEEEEEGNRGSAFLMHESLNDLEKALRSLSPRDLRIPNRDRPYDASPNYSDVSFNSVAILPPPSNLRRPQTPPNTKVFGGGNEQKESPSAVPGPLFRGSLNKAERDAAGLSIASSFMSVRDSDLRPRAYADVPTTPHSGKSTFADMMSSTQDVPPVPSYPAVPLTLGSPLLNHVQLPLRNPSPPSESPPTSTFVPSSPPAKISEESMQRMQYEQLRIRRTAAEEEEEEEEKGQKEELWQPHKLERAAERSSPTSEDFTVGSSDATPLRARSNSITRALKNIKWGRAATPVAQENNSSNNNNLAVASSSSSNNNNNQPGASPPLPPIPLERKISFDGRLHPSFSASASASSSTNGRPPTPSPTTPSFPSPPPTSSPRSTSNSNSTFPQPNQFGKYSLQANAAPSSATDPPSTTSSLPSPKSKSRSRFKTPFSNPFGKKKPSNANAQAAPEVAAASSPEPAVSHPTFFPSSSPNQVRRDESPPPPPQRTSNGNSFGRNSLPHSVSNLSNSNHHQYSPPSSPVPFNGAAPSPKKELRRKPVPTVGAGGVPTRGERTSSQYSTHSRGSSIGGGGESQMVPALPEGPLPLPLRSTSLKAGGNGLGGGGGVPAVPTTTTMAGVGRYDLEDEDGLA